jgi:hypothetical protein
MSEYNGWTNYETWLVKLWIDNDRGEQEYWLERAVEAHEKHVQGDISPVFRIADELKNSFTDQAANMADITGFWSDLIGAALSSVDWREIAQSMLDDAEEMAA